MERLNEEGWTIESHCLGQQRGYDIVALRGSEKLIVEVKGARANPKSPTQKKTHFSSGQIKTHFGVAIIKAIETKLENPDAIVAIAQPDDADIRRVIEELIPFLKSMDIEHFWVEPNKMSTSDPSDLIV